MSRNNSELKLLWARQDNKDRAVKLYNRLMSKGDGVVFAFFDDNGIRSLVKKAVAASPELKQEIEAFTPTADNETYRPRNYYRKGGVINNISKLISGVNSIIARGSEFGVIGAWKAGKSIAEDKIAAQPIIDDTILMCGWNGRRISAFQILVQLFVETPGVNKIIIDEIKDAYK